MPQIGLRPLLPAAPTCTPRKEPTTVPTKLVVAPMAVATLVTSSHLKIETTQTRATSRNPARMIHSP